MSTRLGIGAILATVLSATFPAITHAYTFPGAIPKGLQAAGVGSASTGTILGGLTTTQTDPENSGVLSSQAAASVQLNASVGGTASGSVTAHLTAGYGNLSMSASATVNMFHAGANETDFSTAGVSLLNSLPNMAYQDTLTLVSATLPVGTPVSVLLTNITTGTITGPQGTQEENQITSSFQATDNPAGGGSTLEPELLFSTTLSGTNTANDTRSQTLNLSIGDMVVIGGYLDTNFGAGTGSGTATATASQTFEFSVLTPGSSYTSASGTVYAAATPEPASLSLLALAVPFLARRRARA